MSALAPSRAVIDLGSYAHNLRQVRALIAPSCAIMAVVKANAYGHGAVPISRCAVEQGAAMLGVATVAEGIELRQAGLSIPILVLGEPFREAIEPALEHDLRLTVSSIDAAETIGALSRQMNRVTPVHCKVDTGMGRQGFPLERALQDLLSVARLSHLDIEGISTHFASANETDDRFTAGQILRFRQLLREVEANGIPFEMAHAANSAAIAAHPDACFDMVRAGLMTYGMWPLDAPGDTPLLRPVLRWESRVLLVKTLRPGATVGYGRTYTVQRPSRVAFVPVGYGDGYRYAFSNRAEVLIGGRRRPVLGTVCMDQIAVDVTDEPGVAPGDRAVLIGADGQECIRAEELARIAGTISYEITTAILPRVEREYRNEG